MAENLLHVSRARWHVVCTSFRHRIPMELLLNAVWVTTLVWLMTNGDRVPVPATRRATPYHNFLRLALHACVLAILFPVISLSDDLNWVRRFSSNPLRHSKHHKHHSRTIVDDSALDSSSTPALVLPDGGPLQKGVVGRVESARFDFVGSSAAIDTPSRSPPSNLNT